MTTEAAPPQADRPCHPPRRSLTNPATFVLVYENQAMSTIVWTTLITAVATVSASLGAVWIKGHFDDRTQARQADHNRATAREEQQRQLYGELVKTARLALSDFRQLRHPFVVKAPDVQAVKEAFNQAASLTADMNQAAALAELVGSARGRQCARIIYDKAKDCADLFRFQELTWAFRDNAFRDAAGGDTFPEGTWKGIKEAIGFDDVKITAQCAELEAAIDQFIETVNAELGQRDRTSHTLSAAAQPDGGKR
jgi:hypothetical protein